MAHLKMIWKYNIVWLLMVSSNKVFIELSNVVTEFVTLKIKAISIYANLLTIHIGRLSSCTTLSNKFPNRKIK